ncbi:phage minor tail protein L [Chromobacterium violaceum]|uniref:phage minor tail protein L n=1 Tax=Chromobacterium violaceum TaxID=536 RepID=UPI0009D93186|nr:phage minor tail protein L [Chromobacterium violaceum]OQS45869.1 phage minor tail protein L [Chromobacterium violaceum]OQS47502.1 phage minor tail protein L [Chromobacterium violaceum]
MGVIHAEKQKLVPDAIVQLFELRPPPGVSVPAMRFTASGNGQAVTFQGLAYEPWAIDARGFESSQKGAPRPKLSIGNVATLPDGREVRGIFTALVMQHQGLVGWRLIRRVTHAKFCAGGELADFPEMYPEETWLINRREADNGDAITFELRSRLDLAGKRAPGVLVTRYCPAHVVYRGAHCGYQGVAMFDAREQPVTDLRLDKCGKRLASCRIRNNLANYGGCPGMRRYT